MEPRIQYAQTKGGVNPAFRTLATASHKPLAGVSALAGIRFVRRRHYRMQPVLASRCPWTLPLERICEPRASSLGGLEGRKA